MKPNDKEYNWSEAYKLKDICSYYASYLIIHDVLLCATKHQFDIDMIRRQRLMWNFECKL